MDIITSLAIIALAALVHTSFQLSVSVLTLMSGHAIGAKKTRARLLMLSSSFAIGAGVMTLLLLSFISLMFLHFYGGAAPLLTWSIGCGLVLGIGIAVWLFYFRKAPGTQLWVPRAFAKHLSTRSKATHLGTEAFSLGMTSVISEIIFIVPSLVISALVLLELPSEWQLVGIALYTFISLLGLLIVWALIGSGTPIAKIQKWRETNKHFIQFSAGSALVVLGFFVYVSRVVAGASGVI